MPKRRAGSSPVPGTTAFRIISIEPALRSPYEKLLLSIEFLRLIRSHLNPGGIHFYNTTFSKEVLLTGATEFPHSLRVGSFLAVSDDPILVDKQRWATSLNNYRIDGKPIFDSKDPLQRRSIDQILSLADTIGDPDGSVKLRLEPGDNLRKRLKNNRLVTDDNMGTEWL